MKLLSVGPLARHSEVTLRQRKNGWVVEEVLTESMVSFRILVVTFRGPVV